MLTTLARTCPQILLGSSPNIKPLFLIYLPNPKITEKNPSSLHSFTRGSWVYPVPSLLLLVSIPSPSRFNKSVAILNKATAADYRFHRLHTLHVGRIVCCSETMHKDIRAFHNDARFEITTQVAENGSGQRRRSID